MNARPTLAVMAPAALTSTVPMCVTVPVDGLAHCVPQVCEKVSRFLQNAVNVLHLAVYFLFGTKRLLLKHIAKYH